MGLKSAAGSSLIIASWNTSAEFLESREKEKLIPVKGERNILITSALPYVNNVPHLGNIIGCVLSADVFSRYCHLKNYRYLYVCGTDEYGTATETKALQEGVTPREICDRYYGIHKSVYDWFNIEFDHFGRTTNKHQKEIAQDVFLKCYENGYTSVKTIDQLHCEKCQRFLADRFVHGECPYCKYEDARGDQCDACAKVINAVELINPKCQLCGFSPIVKPSTHIFLHLDELSEEVEAHFNEQVNRSESHWSSVAVSITLGWIKGGLEKRCITRDLSWGTPVPLAEFSNKVFYVWFDAPIGYLSITKDLIGDNWTKWWKNPSDVELYNFVGKDNVAFHSVMFPASLIGTRDGYTMVNHLCATEYLNYEDTKFSKSRGIGIFGDSVQDVGIEPDVWRFYLLYMRPETQDTSFSWNDFALKVNAELLSNLGNFVNRALTFLSTSFCGIVPEMNLTEVEGELLLSINEDMREFNNLMESVKLRDGLIKVLNISRKGNQYIQSNQPWAMIKGCEEDRMKAATVIGVASNLACLLAVLLYPYMPAVSSRICKQCGLQSVPSLPVSPIAFLRTGHKIGKPEPLFAKIEKEKINEMKRKFGDPKAAEASEGARKGKQIHTNTKKLETRKGKFMENTNCSQEEESRQGKGDASLLKYQHLINNGKRIEELLSAVALKWKQKRNLFAAEKLKELEQTKTKLTTKINELLQELAALEETDGVEATKRTCPNTSNSPLCSPLPITNANRSVLSAESSKEMTVILGDDEIDVGRLDLRVGRIVKAEKHANADTLYVEQVDLGEKTPRTVVSGLARHIPLEQMQNRLVVCVCNLKPVKMRGVQSCAMVLCASTSEKVEILDVDSSSVPGLPVFCDGYIRRPDAVLNPKKKIFESVAEHLSVNSDGKACFKGVPLLVDGKTPVTAPCLRHVPVK